MMAAVFSCLAHMDMAFLGDSLASVRCHVSLLSAGVKCGEPKNISSDEEERRAACLYASAATGLKNPDDSAFVVASLQVHVTPGLSVGTAAGSAAGSCHGIRTEYSSASSPI